MGCKRVILHRLLVALTVILLIAVSAGVGLLVANWPDWLRYVTSAH